MKDHVGYLIAFAVVVAALLVLNKTKKTEEIIADLERDERIVYLEVEVDSLYNALEESRRQTIEVSRTCSLCISKGIRQRCEAISKYEALLYEIHGDSLKVDSILNDAGL